MKALFAILFYFSYKNSAAESFFSKNLICSTDFSVVVHIDKAEKLFSAGNLNVDLDKVEFIDFMSGDLRVARAYVKNGITFHTTKKNVSIIHNEVTSSWTITVFRQNKNLKSECLLR